MPAANRFRHQDYTAPIETERIVYLRPAPPPPLESAECRQRMRLVAEQLRDHGVFIFYLVHGTFVGTDALGLLRQLNRLLPSLTAPLHALQQQLVERLLDDAGNFTRQYAQTLDDQLNAGFRSPIEIRLFQWSSENHHIGRAEGAVRLLDDLLQSAPCRQGRALQGRALLWGHSHGGNLFALLTNLLGSDPQSVRRFFRAAQPYFQGSLRRRSTSAWQRVHEMLQDPPVPLQGRQLDLVTMGTPVRYGWDRDGYGNLLHVVHHRATAGWPSFQMRFPPTLDDVRLAASGDLIQWLGIAGTNFHPPLWSWRAWRADIRLHRLFQRGIRRRDLLAHLQRGHRIHADGTTLLVDYRNGSGNEERDLAGHAIYTRKRWMLFHLEETVKYFYGAT